MKKTVYIFLLFITIVSCQRDSNVDSYFVSAVNLHLTYKQLGKEVDYTNPLKVVFTNSTEQLTYTFLSDKKGNVEIKGLLPGEYIINVSSQLTKDEMAIVTGDENAEDGFISGFISNINLRLNQLPDFSKLTLGVIPSGNVVFKELYYAGSKTPSEMTYRNDGFYTIHNNSLEDINLNDYYIASVENYGGKGLAGPLWPDEKRGEYQNIYAMTLWKIVISSTPFILKPGQDAVIAVMAAPHNKKSEYNPTSPIDLSNADFEAYINNPSNSYPDFQAKNMQLVFWPSFSYLWRISVFGQGMALIKATPEQVSSFQTVTLPQAFQDPFEDDEYWLCKKIPNKFVVDAVDLSDNKSSTLAKRFPPSLDAGVASVESIYCGKSVIRKVLSKNDNVVIYQDTNNSSEDFEINDKPLSK